MIPDMNQLYPTIPRAPPYAASPSLAPYILQSDQQEHQGPRQVLQQIQNIPQHPIQPTVVEQPQPGPQNNPISKPTQSEPHKIFFINSGTPPFGHVPQMMTCPHCNQRMRTNIKYRSTFRTHITALVFCITGFWCLVPLPYCMDSCQRVDHFCKHCNQFVGKSGK